MPRWYTDSRWRAVRAAILERDGYRCQIQGGPTCTQIATQVDHIIPIRLGGAWLDPANLRASCAKCNRARVGKGTDDYQEPRRGPSAPSRRW